MVTLHRPVGLYELALVAELDWRAFPPRLPEQPIFYPVLDRSYAEQIASQWHPPDPNSGFMGFVTTFRVPDAAVAPYDIQIVGADQHRELWVPAGEQDALTAAIDGLIEVQAAWVGPRAKEALPGWTGPAGAVSADQIGALVQAAVAGPRLGGPLTAGAPKP